MWSLQDQTGFETGICSASKTVFFGDDNVIIGERLNPTGKKALKAALRAKTWTMCSGKRYGAGQGAHILDVNMGSRI
jgi:5-methyltetrahydrofolate--homocysteine methyltransferase